jgi:hypothetical protein
MLAAAVLLFAALAPAAFGGRGAVRDDERFSFEFRGTTVSAALQQIAASTGVAIQSNEPISQRIEHKFFNNRPLGRIIEGVVRDVNCAIIWGNRDGAVYSIGVWVYPKEKGAGGAGVPPGFRDMVMEPAMPEPDYSGNQGFVEPEPEPMIEPPPVPEPSIGPNGELPPGTVIFPGNQGGGAAAPGQIPGEEASLSTGSAGSLASAGGSGKGGAATRAATPRWKDLGLLPPPAPPGFSG